MTTGHYEQIHRRTGAHVTPVFFTASVLDKYREDPNYVVSAYRISTRDGALADVESSGIQQYVWGHTASGLPCVVALIAHLCALSARDQEFWRLHELTPQDAEHARIDERYRKAMLFGEFPDTVSAFDAISLYLREMQRLFPGERLFTNFDGVHYDFLAPLAYNSRKAMAEFAQALCSLLAINLKAIAGQIASSERKARADVCVTKQQNRNLLRLYFQELGVMSAEIELGLDALRDLNDWRVASAHTLVPTDADQDYRAVQADLVDRLQCGLRAMLSEMVTATGAPRRGYSDYVLRLKVSEPFGTASAVDFPTRGDI